LKYPAAPALLELQPVPPDVWYSWLPGAGWVIDFKRPQLGLYEVS